MFIVEKFVFQKLKDYREQANTIDLFIDFIKKLLDDKY
jgi:hypothetical protein